MVSMDSRVDIVRNMGTDFCIQLQRLCTRIYNQHHLHLQRSQDSIHRRYRYSGLHIFGRRQCYQGWPNILDLVEIHLLGSNHPFLDHHKSNQYQNTAPHRQHAATAVTGERAAQVLKNTYMLLGLSLMVATGAAVFAMAMGIGYVNVFVTLGVYFGLLFATNKLRNSSWGILAVFGLTGWLGFTTGPIINMYAQINGGMEIVSLALGGTASIFVAMSGIALVTRKDFSFMTNFIMVGILVAFLAGLAAVFFNIPALSLAVSAAFVLLSSLLILWQTSAIIHGGETNYIMATVTLFVSIYNLFLSLLHILTALSGND